MVRVDKKRIAHYNENGRYPIDQPRKGGVAVGRGEFHGGVLYIPPLFIGGAGMDIAQIMQLISNYGFPVVCAIAMFVMLERERQSHKEEIDKIKESLDNNTLIIQKLSFLLEEVKESDNS